MSALVEVAASEHLLRTLAGSGWGVEDYYLAIHDLNDQVLFRPCTKKNSSQLDRSEVVHCTPAVAVAARAPWRTLPNVVGDDPSYLASLGPRVSDMYRLMSSPVAWTVLRR
jgi:hypothetical protein